MATPKNSPKRELNVPSDEQPTANQTSVTFSAHHRKYVGVSTAIDAACFVLVLDAPLRVRRRRRVLAIDAAASPKHAHVLLTATT